MPSGISFGAGFTARTNSRGGWRAHGGIRSARAVVTLHDRPRTFRSPFVRATFRGIAHRGWISVRPAHPCVRRWHVAPSLDQDHTRHRSGRTRTARPDRCRGCPSHAEPTDSYPPIVPGTANSMWKRVLLSRGEHGVRLRLLPNGPSRLLRQRLLLRAVHRGRALLSFDIDSLQWGLSRAGPMLPDLRLPGRTTVCEQPVRVLSSEWLQRL